MVQIVAICTISTPTYANYYTNSNTIYSKNSRDIVYTVENLERMLNSPISKWVSNNGFYYYGLSQVDTGKYSNTNCGATSVAMVEKYVKGKQTLSISQIRDRNYGDSSGWYNNNVKNGLDNLGIKNKTANKGSLFEFNFRLSGLISNGGMAIIGVRFNKLNKGIESSRLGRKYDMNGWDGHYILVKGYVDTDDGKTYYETYDPNRGNKDIFVLYSNQNIYYEGENLYNSLLFNDYIAVNKY